MQTCRQCTRELSYSDTQDNRLGFCRACWNQLHCWNTCPFPVSIATYDRIISKRKFGVEIETDECPNFRDLFDSGWGCHYDGSISGMEFVSPILYGDEGLESIEKICKVAADNDWKTYKHECGIHVHVDMRKEPIEALKATAYAYARAYKGWFKLVDPCRVEGEYCHPHDYNRYELKQVDTINDFCDLAINQCRSAWINIAAYLKYNTFELRAHHASLDAKEIGNWVTANLLFVDKVKDMTFNEIDEFFADPLVGLFKCWPDTLVRYYEHRALVGV